MNNWNVAIAAATQGLINCYSNETGRADLVNAAETPEYIHKSRGTLPSVSNWLRIRLDATNARLWVPVTFPSLTGNHRLDWPAVWEPEHAASLKDCTELSPDLAAAKLLKAVRDFAAQQAPDDQSRSGKDAQLFARFADSVAKTASILEAKSQPRARATPFTAAEQSLWLGHPLHPVPKSRVGMRDEDHRRYSPEFGAAFALHYLSVDAKLVWQKQAIAKSATEILNEILTADAKHDPELAGVLEREQGRILLPMHPLMVQDVFAQPLIIKHLRSGGVRYLGPLGSTWSATASVRTLVHSREPWMMKVSLGIEITNSKRINRHRELLRSIEAHELLANSKLAPLLHESFPTLQVITDPAVAVFQDGEEVIEELAISMRPNPFAPTANVAMLATINQDPLPGDTGRIAAAVQRIAMATGRTVPQVAVEWYERFLKVCVRPILGLYIRHGVAIEAHQQNLVLALDHQDFPERAYYRDNQGIFHHDLVHDELCKFVPELGEESGSIGPVALVDERLSYYLVFNSVFGTASAVAYQCQISDASLLACFRNLLHC